MPPKLRQKYPNLPKYVTESNGRIVYRPRIAPQDQAIIPTDKHGYLKPPIRLGASDAPESEILAAYLRASTALDNQRGAKRRDLRWIIDQYKQSRAFRDLAPGTQKRTTALEKILDHPLMIDGHQQTLGDLQPGLITKPIARRIAEKRLNNYQAAGRKGTAMVNREITYLSTARYFLSLTCGPCIMSLITCKECGASVSSKANKCQSCGAPVPSVVSSISSLLGVIGFGLLAYAGYKFIIIFH